MKWKILLGLIFVTGIASGIFLINSLMKEDTREEVEVDQVEINRAKWDDAKINDYDLIALYSDSILSSYQMELSVRDGVVSSYWVTCLVPENDPCEQERFDPTLFTVPALFARLEAATATQPGGNSVEVGVYYHEDYGFPTLISEYDVNLDDSTTQVLVVGFGVVN